MNDNFSYGTTSVFKYDKTNIRIGRKGSLGLDGTIRNAKHHAQPTLPLIKALVALLPQAGFKDWVQYNNVHTLVTVDDRQFNCRPLVYDLPNGERTWGIRVSCRVSRSQEITLFDVKTIDDVARAFQFFSSTNSVGENLYCNAPATNSTRE